MTKKDWGIVGALLSLLMIIFEVTVHVLGEFYYVTDIINPILFVVTAICFYLYRKDEMTFSSKWVWSVFVIYLTYTLLDLSLTGIYFCRSITGEYNISLVENALDFISEILVSAAGLFILISLLYKSKKSFMSLGFAFFAISPVLSVISVYVLNKKLTLSWIMPQILLFALYVILAVMATERFEKAKNIFRIAVIVLAALSYSNLGFFNFAAIIILVFLFVPGVKISFKKIIAFLCAALAIFSVVIFVNAEPLANIQSINDHIKADVEELAECEERIPVLEKKIETKEAEYADAKDLLNVYKKDLDTANANLDKVCTRSYYSSWTCNRARCYDLHNKVDVCESLYDDQKYKVNDLRSEIDSAKSTLKSTKNRIILLKDEIVSLKAKRVQAIFVLIVDIIETGLVLVALIYLVRFVLQGTKKFAFVSCITMISGSLLYLFRSVYNRSWWSFNLLDYPLITLLVNPYFWSALTITLLTILAMKEEGKRVLFRVLTIISAIITTALVVVPAQYVLGNTEYCFILYGAIMVCMSLLLVPLTFTEYNGIGKYLFLTIITCGIWNLIWTYKVTKNLNKVSSAASRKPIVELLLCMFLPFYYIYWIFKTAEGVEAYGTTVGKKYNLNILCLAISFVCPLFSTILIQDKINQIVGKPE